MKLVIGVLMVLTSTAQAGPQVLIPAGEFRMGCSPGDTACGADEVAGIVNVPVFNIDVYEVTVIEYERCIEAGRCSRPKDHAYNQYCNLGAHDRPVHPINCVDWPQALAYCEWRDMRLPYEAEWEKAARAGTGSRYPWGHEVDCTRAILDDGKTLGSVPGEPDGCGEDHAWMVGSRAPNAIGLYDMHGNAAEWTMNWYTATAINDHYAKGDLQGPAGGRQRVVRGGSWDENRDNLRSSFRNVKPPLSGDSVYGSIGFRCVKAD